jgi:hypothetical protein
VELSCLNTRKTLHRAAVTLKSRIARLNLTYFAATRNDAIGSKRTNRAALTMSVIEGRPEVIDLRPNRSD